MPFWNEPIEIGRLWRGPRLRTPFATYSCVWLGRITVILALAVFALFLILMVAFEAFLLVHAPVIALSGWAVSGAIAFLLLRNRKHGTPPDDPDDPTEGTGIPIPRIPAPVQRIGASALDFPVEREWYG